MSIAMRPHGPDWKRTVRQSPVCVAMGTPAWLRDRFVQGQVAYARQLGKPISLLVQRGTPPPPTRPGDHGSWGETLEEMAQMLVEVHEGDR
jgi:hypothetical protein